jgi:hypothetical protein
MPDERSQSFGTAALALRSPVAAVSLWSLARGHTTCMAAVFAIASWAGQARCWDVSIFPAGDIWAGDTFVHHPPLPARRHLRLLRCHPPPVHGVAHPVLQLALRVDRFEALRRKRIVHCLHELLLRAAVPLPLAEARVQPRQQHVLRDLRLPLGELLGVPFALPLAGHLWSPERGRAPSGDCAALPPRLPAVSPTPTKVPKF